MIQKITLLYIFLCYTFITNAQKNIYFNNSGNSVTLDAFNELLLKSKNGWGFKVEDSTYLHFPSKAYEVGTLNKERLLHLQKSLKNYYPDSLNFGKIVFVAYIGDVHYKFNSYKRTFENNYGYFLDTDVSKIHEQLKINKEALVTLCLHKNQLFKPQYYYYSTLSKVDSDKVMDPLFPLSFPYMSYFYLKPDGSYLLINGVSINRANIGRLVKSFVAK